MFGKMVYVRDDTAKVELIKEKSDVLDLINIHVIFVDNERRVLGEVVSIENNVATIHFLGEFVGNNFISGLIKKPAPASTIRIINSEELSLIIGQNDKSSLLIGGNPLYDNYPIRVKINDLFSHHLAILGNTGSGKSCGVAKILQNILYNPHFLPYNANIILFDPYGEYHNAFKDINKVSPHLHFKVFSSNKDVGELIKIPLWLLDVRDMALLLSATEVSQSSIIEKMMKIVRIFSLNDENSNAYKNHLIAKAIMSILYTNQPSASKRNDIFAVLADCSTPEFNLEANIQGVGYQRKLRDCFLIDNQGQFTERVLITQYIAYFIKEHLDNYEVKETNYYTLADLAKALDFTLISEGLLHNGKTYSDAISLKVKLHTLIIGENAKYFKYDRYITKEEFINNLLITNGAKNQIINFDLEDIEDTFCIVLIKMLMRMLFDYSRNIEDRASKPFHIFLEEAHRYIKNDSDNEILGYNIFERIAKEGRKYGMILNIISQRPVDLPEAVISQCSNFMIFKMNHPRDIDYVKKMLPSINSEIVEKQKTLQPGTCVAFGKAFKVPMIIKMEMPNPAPYSSNCDVENRWK